MKDNAPKKAGRAGVEIALEPRHVWQPFTPRGVAGFATRPARRVMAYAVVMAVVSGLTVAWALSFAWFPIIREGIRRLPPDTRITAGRLQTPAEGPFRLAGDERLALELDAQGGGTTGNEPDVKVIFRPGHLAVCSLLGCWTTPYPPDYRIGLTRAEAEPWWGAREWTFRWGAVAGTAAGLYLLWLLLAALYAPGALLMARIARRPLTFGGAWRLSLAALMPGAAVAIVGILGYAVGEFNLVRFGLIQALHWVVGWVFVAASPWFLGETSHEARRFQEGAPPAEVEPETPAPAEVPVDSLRPVGEPLESAPPLPAGGTNPFAPAPVSPAGISPPVIVPADAVADAGPDAAPPDVPLEPAVRKANPFEPPASDPLPAAERNPFRDPPDRDRSSRNPFGRGT